MINNLRGTFTVPIAGERVAFDTTLGAIAHIEERSGGRAIMEIVSDVVTGRRAGDQIELVAAALESAGHADPKAQAARATVPEAEAFILAFMGALGFTLTPRHTGERPDGEEPDPLAGSSAGAAGAPSRSAA